MNVHLQPIGNSYYFACGAVLNAEGKRKPKKFCLGGNYDAAKQKAIALSVAWDMETTKDATTGLKIWSQERIEGAMAFATGSAPLSAPPKPPTPTPVLPKQTYVPPPAVYTLGAALDDYAKQFQTRNDMSLGWREAIAERVKSVKEAVADSQHKALLDRPLPSIGHEEMYTLRAVCTARPPSQQKIIEGGNPIAVDTCHHWLKTLGMGFAHFERVAKFGWKAPNAYWREAFSLTKKQKWQLMTPSERGEEGKPKDIYTIDEVGEIYRKATPRGKRYILMGVCFGWGQELIASLRKDELMKAGNDHYIEHRRSKTGERGKWWCPPEVAQVLIDAMSRTPANADNLAFLSEKELPLLHGSTDNIKMAWDRTLNAAYGTRGTKQEKAGAKRLPFGRLRKLAGQMVQDVSGSHELAQLLLCHKSQTMAAQHYVSASALSGLGKPLQERLFDTQRAIWEQIRHLFFPQVALKKAA